MVVFSVLAAGQAVVVALDASTGASRWARTLPGQAYGGYSDLLLTPSRVVRATTGRLTVLDRAGALLWDSSYVEVGGTSGAHVRGDTILVATGRTVTAWRLSSGAVLWRRDYPADSEFVRLSGVTVSGDTVYASGTRFGNPAVTKQGLVWALRSTGGTTAWRLELPVAENGHFMGAAAVAGPLLVLTDFGAGGLQAVDRFTGSRKWRTIGLPCCVGGFGTPVLLGSLAFSTGGDETVRAIDLATGIERWRTQSEGSFGAQAVLCGSRVWGQNLALRAFEVGSGALVGVALDGTEEYASSGLATARGLVFVASKQRFNAFACN
jgi:outer membrane protein assembly factor BamB